MLSPLDTLMLPSVSVVVVVSELKRRMKAEKKASEKEAKVKEQVEQKETNDQAVQNAYGADEETLDPNVSYMDVYDRPSLPLVICFRTFDC